MHVSLGLHPLSVVIVVTSDKRSRADVLHYSVTRATNKLSSQTIFKWISNIFIMIVLFIITHITTNDGCTETYFSPQRYWCTVAAFIAACTHTVIGLLSKHRAAGAGAYQQCYQILSVNIVLSPIWPSSILGNRRPSFFPSPSQTLLPTHSILPLSTLLGSSTCIHLENNGVWWRLINWSTFVSRLSSKINKQKNLFSPPPLTFLPPLWYLSITVPQLPSHLSQGWLGKTSGYAWQVLPVRHILTW